ncbi:MarR family transcriptional regulator [Jeotgalibaca sp. MA1X17-3]|uniref:MarR family winged helix-turn-helix transcriptional regulator n=1 Tax=Jeotgalibaca sp. MA1X17-3 TaxID=2908211 RepID=UPI001F1D4478|nr:MarR family transcriptional regulator [Jeotgalibaca sp. MA1X17-3]UJF15364.1 MarR family transcriptional regulator [Jeotgalibaca sp. MA1X17-3]
MNNLATSMKMSNGNTSTLCKKLEKQGWIVRERRLDDERYISLSLSKKGREAIHSLNEYLHAHYEPFLDEVDEETISHIHLGLKELKKVIELINLEQRKEESQDAKRTKE